MSLSVGYPAMYNRSKKKWEEVYLCTKATEVFFADGETLEYKVKTGQFNGKDGKNGADGLVKTVTVPGTCDWIYIAEKVTKQTGTAILTSKTQNGAQFVSFGYEDEEGVLHRCYGYWLRNNANGSGVIMSWQPTFGVWNMFIRDDNTFVVEQTYPIDKRVWINAEPVFINNGGYGIHNAVGKDGIYCLSLSIERQQGFLVWTRYGTEGTGIFSDLNNNIYLVWKNGITLNGKLLTQGDQATVIKDFDVDDWKEITIRTYDGGKTLRENTRQGLSCVKAVFEDCTGFGYWLNYQKTHGIGLFFVYSLSSVNMYIAYSFNEDMLHKISVYNIDSNTDDIETNVVHARVTTKWQELGVIKTQESVNKLLTLKEGMSCVSGKFNDIEGCGYWLNFPKKIGGTGILFSNDCKIYWLYYEKKNGFFVRPMFTISDLDSTTQFTGSFKPHYVGTISVNSGGYSVEGAKLLNEKTQQGCNNVQLVISYGYGNSYRCTGFWNKVGDQNTGLFFCGNVIWIGESTDSINLTLTKVWPVSTVESSTFVLWKNYGTIPKQDISKLGALLNGFVGHDGLHLVKFDYNNSSFKGTWLKTDKTGFGLCVENNKNYYLATKEENTEVLNLYPVHTVETEIPTVTGFVAATAQTVRGIISNYTCNFSGTMRQLKVGEYCDLEVTLLHEGKNVKCNGSLVKLSNKFGEGAVSNETADVTFKVTVTNNQAKFTLL